MYRKSFHWYECILNCCGGALGIPTSWHKNCCSAPAFAEDTTLLKQNSQWIFMDIYGHQDLTCFRVGSRVAALQALADVYNAAWRWEKAQILVGLASNVEYRQACKARLLLNLSGLRDTRRGGEREGRVAVGGWWPKEDSREGINKNLREHGERVAALVRVRVGYSITQCPGSSRACPHPLQLRYHQGLIQETWELRPGLRLLDGVRMSAVIPWGGFIQLFRIMVGRQEHVLGAWWEQRWEQTNPRRWLGSMRVLMSTKKYSDQSLISSDPLSPVAKGQKKNSVKHS